MSDFDHTEIDRLIHSRIRLSVMAILASVDHARFTFLRDKVNTSDGNLSTHLSRLEDAGYVEAEKTFVERKPLTRYRLTGEGRRAFRAYVDRMETLLGSGGEDER